MTINDLADMRRARARTVDAQRRKRNQLAALHGLPTGYIDPTPIREHTMALVDLGWSLEAIVLASRAHVTRAALRLVVDGAHERAHHRFQRILAMPLTLHVPAHVPDTCKVPAAGAHRRIQALMAIGWRHEDMLAAVGHHTFAYADSRYARITADAWRAVDRAYEQMCATPGGSSRARTRALGRGFVPPLGWDDIDDPGEVPSGWEYAPADRATRLADCDTDGLGVSEVCRRLGVTRHTLQQWCGRESLSPLYRRLCAREDGMDADRNRGAA